MKKTAKLVMILSAFLAVVFGVLTVTTFFSSDYVRAKDKVEYLETQREKYQNNEYSTYSEAAMESAISNLAPIKNRGILFVSITGCSVLIFAVATYFVISSKKSISKEKKVNKTPKTTDATDELKKFKELLDLGAITEEEFNSKKKELLGL